MPGFVLSAATITGAVGFAVAQPLYDLLGRNATFFIAHQADGRDLLLLSLLLSLGLPLALTLAVATLGVLNHRLHRLAFGALMAVCGALFALGACRSLEVPGMVAFTAAAVFGAALAWLSGRRAAVRGLALLGLGGLLFPALFLAKPEVRAIWEVDETAPSEAPAVGTKTDVEPGSEEGPATPSVAPSTPVVLVVFDEMPVASLMTPSRELDVGRYPGFARLAATATWYREATTVSQATIYSVPAILTGNYPEANVQKAPAFRHYKRNVFTELGDDLQLNVWETMSHLCPSRLCKPPERWLIPRRQRLASMLKDSAAVFVSVVAPPDWGGALPTLGDQWRDFWGADRAPAADEAPRTMHERRAQPGEVFDWFLNTIEQRGSEPALHYAHVMLPHRPWVWLPSGQRFASYLPYPHGLVNQFWSGSEWETTQGHQRHLLTVGFVDTLVGRLIDTMKRAGIFDEALLAITSDHGGTFRTAQPRRNLRLQPTYEIVGVPIFVKYPRQSAGEIDDRNAETIDIAPTIYAALGHEPKGALDGKNLRGPANAKSDRKQTFRSGNKRSSAGGILEYSAPEQEGRQAALDDIARRFGTGSWDALFAAGPRSDLVGRRLSRLTVTEGMAGDRAEIVDLDAMDDVDPRADLLPIHVFGSLTMRDPEFGGALALAVGGRIQSTTEVFKTDDGLAFSSLLPPAALRSGANRLEVFAILGEGNAAVLHPLEVSHSPREDS
jgi:arylsulfatase A-like enzyme